MNEMTLSVDITPALAALHGGAILSDAGLPSALPPSAAAVEAFQSAMTSLVSDNRSIQSQLEAIVARPLVAPSEQAVPVRNDGTPAVGTHPAAVAFGVPVVMPGTKPTVAAKPLAEVTPEIVKQFAETIAPLVAENREVQVALEKVVPLPLTLPEAKPAVTAEAEPTVAAKPLAEVTPEIVKRFAETIAPLVNENREVQVALEKVVPLPLTAPTPVVETQPVVADKPLAEVTPEIVKQFAETIAPLVAGNREVQVALETAVARPLSVPVSDETARVQSPVVASEIAPVVERSVTPVVERPVASEAKPVVADKPLVEVTPEIVKQFAETIAPLVAGNREVQVALETAVARPLSVPVSDETARVQSPVVASEIAPVGERPVTPVVERPVAPEAKPVVAAKPLVEVTPEIVKQFAETIAPLVAENREVQVALETAMVRPLTAPELKPATKTESANESAPLPSAGEDVVLQAVPVAQEAVVDVVRPEAVQPTVAGIAATGSAPKVAPTPAEVLIVAAEAVADTIMVTPGLLSGEGRIHVQLKPDVLGGTEIQLNVTGRTIAVEFQPQTVEMGALIQRCLPQLEQHLAAKIHSFTIAATVNQSRRRKV